VKVLIDATTFLTLLKSLWELLFRTEMSGVFLLDENEQWPNQAIEPAFRCASCKRLVPWSNGCGDDNPDCDDCWYEKQKSPLDQPPA